MIALRAFPARLARNERGLALMEFALGLPLLLGLTLGALEMSNFIIASNTVQRLATAAADMLSQTGVNNISTSESQIYDMFYALDVAAKPLDLRHRGRVILTVIKGVAQSNNTVRNEFADAIYAQQFDGGYTGAVPLLGCHSTATLPTYARTLPANEIMVHAQVTYQYAPLLAGSQVLSYFSVPATITRTAVFRMRKNTFNITNDGVHPVKSNCTTATGT
ncbi:TadE/TadG family type IV pilus assembly protein [Sphingomonas sp. BIUV-7]|uniref:TadE/TadG family type IV pilus assembly protein n=1 Tax=Sphingomonas natans TaxID=3063330 RepID=A0ABT8Y8N1_9SPHN|nr:TadE/TadG family type IV pilus assembly protein [Sphingomonas sp. BIUV-7]MDO6414680.1 TadE/TadG family type IV pilus assembly protein [Sphingomonas sp. BIUV-7]